MLGHPLRGGCWRRFIDVHDRRRTRDPSRARPRRPWPLALRAAARAPGHHRARPAGDQPRRGRAAASRSALRRLCPRGPYRRVRPLSHEQGARRLLRGGRRLARTPLRAATADRSRERDSRAQRLARGTVSRRHCRRALRRRPPRPARDADPQPILRRLCRGRGGGQLRARVPAGHRRDWVLPDLDALPEELLARTVAFFIASPANPQGAVAELAYLARLVSLARRHGFLIFSDECYSEIYTRHAPASMLEAAGPDFANVVEFQSLSKRSNLPGLRIGFAAGDRQFLARFLELRNVAAPQVPLPAQQVAIAAYGDEAHVEDNRRLYARKFDLADQIIGDRYGYRRPAGGFFLWLDVSTQGGDEAVALRLWREAGLRVVPGRYLARDQADGSNPGRGYI